MNRIRRIYLHKKSVIADFQTQWQTKRSDHAKKLEYPAFETKIELNNILAQLLHKQWYIDISDLSLRNTFHFMCGSLDLFFLATMQLILKKYLHLRSPVITDNGPESNSIRLKQCKSISRMIHVKAFRYSLQADRQSGTYKKAIRGGVIAAKLFSNVEHTRKAVQQCIHNYNAV